MVLRRNADGSQDNTFNGNGRVLLDYGGRTTVARSRSSPTGRSSSPASANPNSDIADHAAAGQRATPDPTFDTDGTIGIDFGGTDTAYAVARAA